MFSKYSCTSSAPLSPVWNGQVKLQITMLNQKISTISSLTTSCRFSLLDQTSRDENIFSYALLCLCEPIPGRTNAFQIIYCLIIILILATCYTPPQPLSSTFHLLWLCWDTPMQKDMINDSMFRYGSWVWCLMYICGAQT